MKNQMTLRSGAVIHEICRKDAEAKNYLTRNTLSTLHLAPAGEPVAFEMTADGKVIYYFHPERVVEADPEIWYAPGSRQESMTLESGTVIERMSVKRAASHGYYTEDRLRSMKYEVVEEPVAFTSKADKSVLYF